MEPFMELSRRRTVRETGEHPFPRRRPASTAPAVVAHFTRYPMNLFTDQSHLARQLERTLWPLFHLLRGHGALCLQLEHLALLDHREPPRSTNGSRNLVQT
jgi:hypothetical protein